MKVLVVIDMQNDFIDGALGTKEAKGIIQNAKNKIDEYRQNQQAIIFTRDTHHLDYFETQEGKFLPIEHCIYGTHGWEINNQLDVPNCSYVNKESFGWPYWGVTMSRLFGQDRIESIEIIGLCTDICVIANAMILKAYFPEIPIVVDSVCCAGSTPERHANALGAMRICQINIKNWEE